MAAKKRNAKKAARKPAKRPGPARAKEPDMDARFEHFVEEIGGHGRRMERRGKKAKDWWYGTFGAIGPLLGAIAGIAFVAIGAWIISLVYAVTGANFLFLVQAFLYANLALFLLIFLSVNYLKHIYLSNRRLYYLVKPVKVALEIAVGFWLLAWAMQFAGMELGSLQLISLSTGILGSLGSIFLLFLVIGYVVAIVLREKEVGYGKAI